MNKQQLQYVTLSILLIILVGSVVILSNRRAPAPGLDQPTNIPIVVTEPTSVVINTTPMTGAIQVTAGQSTMRVGQTQTVQVVLQATGKILDGADAVIRFDPALVTVSGVTNGAYFSQLIRSTVNQNEGTMKVTGFSPLRSSALEAPILFFSFTVTAKQAGNVSFDLAYGQNRSDLSTLVERGTSKNVLTSVSNTAIIIQP